MLVGDPQKYAELPQWHYDCAETNYRKDITIVQNYRSDITIMQNYRSDINELSQRQAVTWHYELCSVYKAETNSSSVYIENIYGEIPHICSNVK